MEHTIFIFAKDAPAPIFFAVIYTPCKTQKASYEKE